MEVVDGGEGIENYQHTPDAGSVHQRNPKPLGISKHKGISARQLNTSGSLGRAGGVEDRLLNSRSHHLWQT